MVIRHRGQGADAVRVCADAEVVVFGTFRLGRSLITFTSKCQLTLCCDPEGFALIKSSSSVFFSPTARPLIDYAVLILPLGTFCPVVYFISTLSSKQKHNISHLNGS